MRGFGAVVGRAICPSTVTGHSSAVGCVRIGAFPKRNSRSTWGSSSSCTTSASEAKRCCLRSLSCWSRKTLESNKSASFYPPTNCEKLSGKHLAHFEASCISPAPALGERTEHRQAAPCIQRRAANVFLSTERCVEYDTTLGG